VLEERVKSGGPLGLGQNSEPFSLVTVRVMVDEHTLLDSTKLFSEVLIGRCSSHFFEGLLPVGKVLEPLVDLLSCMCQLDALNGEG